MDYKKENTASLPGELLYVSFHHIKHWQAFNFIKNYDQFYAIISNWQGFSQRFRGKDAPSLLKHASRPCKAALDVDKMDDTCRVASDERQQRARSKIICLG